MEESLENTEDRINDIRIENEIKKIKLSLEHGGNFSSMGETNLPPEIEGLWLDYIQKFEDEFSKRKTIPVYEYIGSPDYKLHTDITDDEIETELKRITNIMEEKSVVLETICDVDDRELYRFITEELFKEETNDIHIEGLKTCYIYEEYHPNHAHDITNRCNEFISQVFDKEMQWTPKFLSLSEELISTGGSVTEAEAIRKIELFRDSFGSFSVTSFTISSIAVNEDKDEGDVHCEMEYIGTLEGSVESMQFSGPGFFKMKKLHDWWTTCQVSLPGLII